MFKIIGRRIAIVAKSTSPYQQRNPWGLGFGRKENESQRQKD
jgi:hypothetical protein